MWSWGDYEALYIFAPAWSPRQATVLVARGEAMRVLRLGVGRGLGAAAAAAAAAAAPAAGSPLAAAADAAVSSSKFP